MNTLKLNVSPQLVSNNHKNILPIPNVIHNHPTPSNTIQYQNIPSIVPYQNIPNSPVQYQTAIPTPTNAIIYQPTPTIQYQTIPIHNTKDTLENYNAINLKPIIPITSNIESKSILTNIKHSDIPTDSDNPDADSELMDKNNIPPKADKIQTSENSNQINLDKIIKTSADLKKIESNIKPEETKTPSKKTRKKKTSTKKKTKNKIRSQFLIKNNKKLVILILLYTNQIYKPNSIKISDINKNILSENDVIQLQKYINSLNTKQLELIKKYAYGQLNNKESLRLLDKIIINPSTKIKKSIIVFKDILNDNNLKKGVVYQDSNSNIFHFNPFYNWNLKKKNKKILKLVINSGSNILVYYKNNIFNDGIAILPNNIKYKVMEKKDLKYTNLTVTVYTLTILKE